MKEEYTTEEIITIDDLREKDFNGEPMTNEQREALHNFDRYRIAELNKQPNDLAFHERYRQLLMMANLVEFTEFLKEKYSAGLQEEAIK